MHSRENGNHGHMRGKTRTSVPNIDSWEKYVLQHVHDHHSLYRVGGVKEQCVSSRTELVGPSGRSRGLLVVSAEGSRVPSVLRA